MSQVIGTIITDCADQNARTRQQLRFNALFGAQPAFLGVDSYSPIEAAGNLVEQLDILTNFPLTPKDREIVVLVNVAPRGEDVKEQYDNGTPFCYFRIGKTLVVSTYEGQCLALARDFGIIDEVELMDIPTVTAAAVTWGDLTSEEAQRINQTQFRSLEFMPLIAHWLLYSKPVPSEKKSLTELPSAQGVAWHVDNFGNVKTTLLEKDVEFEEGKEVMLSSGKTAICYRRLTDVPAATTALTVGSSGYGNNRFLEVVIGHRGRATDVHNLAVGSKILVSS